MIRERETETERQRLKNICHFFSLKYSSDNFFLYTVEVIYKRVSALRSHPVEGNVICDQLIEDPEYVCEVIRRPPQTDS